MRDLEARDLTAATLPAATQAERQFVQAVTRFETSNGDGWKEPCDTSNNHGAVTALPGQPFCEYQDTDAAGNPITQRFRMYDSDAAGLADAARTILKTNVRAALKRGDARRAVYAMHENGYFVAPPERYAANVAKHYDAMLGALPDEPRLLGFGSSSVRSAGPSGGGALTLFGLALAGLLLLRFRR